MATFKAVTEIRHGAKDGDTEVIIPAGAEVKKSDFNEKEWTQLLAAGSITGTTSDELKEAEQVRAEVEAGVTARDLLARAEALDVRESQLESREASLKEQMEQLKADQEALETERKAFETVAKEQLPKKETAAKT